MRVMLTANLAVDQRFAHPAVLVSFGALVTRAKYLAHARAYAETYARRTDVEPDSF